MAAEGYEYVESTGEHVFRYREYPPTWWAIYPSANRKFALIYAGLGAVIGAVLGGKIAEILAVPLLLIGGAAGFVAGKLRDAKETKVHLTGTPDPKFNHRVTDFLVEWRSNADGMTSLYREYEAATAKSGWDGIERFNVAELATVERRSFADLRPDSMQSMIQNNDKDRAEARVLEMTRLVFRDGQEVDAGWQRNTNRGAIVQSSLLDYLNRLGQHLGEQQQQASRAAAIAPDDEAL